MKTLKYLSLSSFKNPAFTWWHRWRGLAALLSSLATALAQDPTITTQPTNQTASLGATVRFSATAVTTSTPLSFQWQFRATTNDLKVDLPGATKDLLTLTNITAVQFGYYSVLVSNAVGASNNSDEAQLILDPTAFALVVNPGWTNSSQYSWSGSWGDYDGDGFIDLFVANSTASWTAWTNFLYRNNGDGTFTRQHEDQVGPMASAKELTWNGYWADVNNDGWLDLLANRLYLNQGDGTFRSADAGDLSKPGKPLPYFASSWGGLADYDNDGCLDLFFVAAGAGGQFVNYLFHGTGDGRFQRVTNGVVATDQCNVSNDAVWGDYNNDGRPDLIVANMQSGPDFFYRNDGYGQFTRMTNSILEAPGYETYHHAWGDYDNDGYLDLAAHGVGACRLFRNDGQGDFVVAVHWQDIQGNPVWADYDNDGDLDLALILGQGTAANLSFLRNEGDGAFTHVRSTFTGVKANWIGGGWADYDNDGFPDLFVSEQNGRNALFHNEGNANHWIKIRLKGTAANASAIGVKVRVKATIGGRTVWQMREVSPAYMCQDDLRPNFGLGDATTVDLVRIEWPSGNVTELADVAVDQILPVTEPSIILPARPSASPGGSIQLTSRTGRDVQWYHEGVLLEGETNRTLTLTHVQEADAGRYSIVIATSTGFSTNFTYVYVDTQFTKVAGEPWDTDLGTSNVAIGDYDGDDDLDVFVGRYRSGRSALYHNNGDGTFQIATNANFPLAIGDYWFGPCSDFDNDGRVDVFVLRPDGTAPSSLYYGHGDGTFAPIPLATISPWWQHSVDFDHDGLLDLYLTSWGAGQTNRLYRNLGDRDFQILTRDDVGAILGPRSFGNAAWADYDDDGWEDVAMPDITSGRCRLYRNLGTGRFEAVTNQITQASLPSALVASWADYDNDDRLDLFVAGGASALYRNLGGGDFERVAFQAPIQGFYNGATWGDYDNDGFQDLFMTYGNGQGNDLFRNNGDGTFTTITRGSIVSDNVAPDASYAGIWFDYDNDGFLDLLVPNGNDPGTAVVPSFLYHNNGNDNAWLKVKLVGTTSNREGAGAKVRVLATIAGASHWQRRDITSGGDPYSGNGPIAHFGLGDATVVRTLQIEWPSGTVQQTRSVATNQFLTIVEPRRPEMNVVITTEGSFQIEFTTESDRTYRLQGSDDLVSWTIVETFTGTGESMRWTEPAAALRRFYRIVSP